ncbi:MAG TPA: hypothetical protein VGB62_10110 [Allosphingosinicella sp.]
MMKNVLYAAAAAAFALAPLAVSAAPLVVRASGPSASAYPPGRALPDNAAVTLKPGDVVTVLVSNSSRTLRGPGQFRLAAAPARSTGAFNARGRFGAMRAGEIPSSPSLWHVDVSQSGTVCYTGNEVKLWRPEAAEAVTLNVAANGTTKAVSWASGQDELPWPAALPLAENQEYTLTWTGNPDPSRLKFARLASVPEDAAGLAKAFIDHGCQTQLDLVLENVPVEGQ